MLCQRTNLETGGMPALLLCIGPMALTLEENLNRPERPTYQLPVVSTAGLALIIVEKPWRAAQRAQMCQAFSLKEIDNVIRGSTAPAIDVSTFLAFARSHFLK